MKPLVPQPLALNLEKGSRHEKRIRRSEKRKTSFLPFMKGTKIRKPLVSKMLER